MLPWGPKRGGIRETVGFEERKAERWEEDWGMVRGMGRVLPHSLQCVIANQ